jgi:predicted ATPase
VTLLVLICPAGHIGSGVATMPRDSYHHENDEGSTSSSNVVDSSPQSTKRLAAILGSGRRSAGGSFSLRPNHGLQRRPSSASTGNGSTRGSSNHNNLDIQLQSPSSEFSIQVMAKNLGSSELVCDDAEDNKRRRKEIQRALKRQNFTLNQLNFDELELYGRARQVSELTAAVEACFSSVGKSLVSSSWQVGGSKRCETAAVRVVSVTGRAGTGKTRLCWELKQRIQARGGFFLSGKFDPQNRMEPYAGIVSALAQLPDLVFALKDDESDALCGRIQEAVGEEQYLLTNLVKDLSRLFYSIDSHRQGGTGSQTQRSVLAIDLEDKYETRSKRFRYLIRQLLQQLERPVVLLLDDVQWSDPSSLGLLSDLVTDSNLPGFLLVTTCREEGVSPSHPYAKLMDDLQQARVAVRRIPLDNLDQSAVHSIVSTALRSSEESTLRLSNIVHQKSSGNPMYVIQFLTNLYDDGILSYNLGLMQWTWDETTVQSRFVTDNVVDLTTSKLQRLEPHLQTALLVGSCLGQTFDKQHLTILLQESRIRALFREARSDPPEESSEPDVSTILEELVKETILDFNPHVDSYSFLHDLIQEAAFQLIPESIRGRLQIEVGRRLLLHHQSSALDDRYYLRAVELSNTGIDRLNSTEGLALAHYNLIAGGNAVAKAAFTAALNFFEAGLKCMGPDAWAVGRWLALELASGAVEASYCSANFEAMEVHMASVLDRDIPISDKIRVYLTRILSYAALDQSEDALDTGRRVLRELGITRLPKNPGNHLVLLELMKTKALLRHHNESTLNALPPLDDKLMFQALSIIDMMQPAAYLFNLKLFAVMNLRSLRWTVKRGVCLFSPTLFATFGIILCGLGDHVSGSAMGKLRLARCRRLPLRLLEF